jgi:predicted alpha/beta-fold hydrolase
MGTNLKRIFQRYSLSISEMFVTHLLIYRNKDIIEANRKDIDVSQVLAAKTIRDYDDAYTKKMFNYSTVDNYYRDASCCRFIEHVRIPLLCINALDDPISSLPCIPFDEIAINPNVVLALTQYGGHLGWFEHHYRPSRWVDKPLTEFIIAMFQACDQRKDIKILDTQVAAHYVKATRKVKTRQTSP